MCDHGLAPCCCQVSVVGGDDNAHTLGAAGIQVAQTAQFYESDLGEAELTAHLLSTFS